MRAPVLIAFLCAGITLSWQALVVKYNYGGNWTGLYCTGDRLKQPPALASEHIWLFKNSYGYDGQAYHYIAHDPLFHRGFDRFVDAPRFRYRRILISGLAYLVAFGQDQYIDPAYIVLVLLSIFLGALWLGNFALRYGWSAWWGMAFLLAPAVLVSIDRLTVDVALAALCVGFALFVETNPGWPLYAVLAAAPLVRDTGFLLLGAYVVTLLFQRRWKRAAVFSTAVLPVTAWYWFVSLHTGPMSTGWVSQMPFASYFHRLMHPPAYPFAWPVSLTANILDYAALAGFALAFLLGLRLLLRRKFTPPAIAIYGFILLAALLGVDAIWSEAYAYGRSLTPLLLLLALGSFRTRKLTPALPLLLVTPRIVLQYVPLAYHIATGILRVPVT